MTSAAEVAVAATEVEVAEPTALYRLYDCDGTLMYVGITSNPERRFSEHASDKHWWPHVTRKAVQWYGTRPRRRVGRGGCHPPPASPV